MTSDEGGKPQTTRRDFLKILSAGIAGLIVGGVGGFYTGWSSKPVSVPPTSTITKKFTKTVTAAALPSEIKIGVLLPLSGDIGPIGAKMLNGAKLAAKQINDRGGIAGRPVKLIPEDTVAQSEKALDAAKKLVEVSGVQVMIGPATSPEVLTVADYLKTRKVPTISMSATAVKISEIGGDYIFRVVSSDAFQSAAVADLIKYFDQKRVATFVISNDYGMGMEHGIKSRVPDRVAVTIRYDPEKGDYREELGRIKAVDADGIFWATWVESGIVAMKQAYDLGLTNVQSMGGEGMADKSFFRDKKAAEYLYTTKMTGTRPTSPKGILARREFVEAYKAVFGEEPGLYGDYTYDAAMVAALAVAYAGAYEGPEINKAIPVAATHYVGPSGFKEMDEHGDVVYAAYDIWKVMKKAGAYDITSIGMWETGVGLRLQA